MHGDCKNLALRLIQCPPTQAKDVNALNLSQTVFGTVTLRLLHAYDMNFAPNGTALYGELKLKGEKSAGKRTADAVCGDNDCVWDTNSGCGLDADKDCVLSIQGLTLVYFMAVLVGLWQANVSRHFTFH